MKTAMTAPSFELPGTDGRTHTLEEYGEIPLLALVQSCNHCPWVQAWEGRMVDLQREYGPRGFHLVAISSNDVEHYPEDSLEEMTKRSAAEGFNFDYLYDESQEIARALGSERTPEVFLFDGGRQLVYHGAIDDNRDETAVTRHHLREAIEALLAGREPEVRETPPVGCSVKYRS